MGKFRKVGIYKYGLLGMVEYVWDFWVWVYGKREIYLGVWSIVMYD